VGCFAAHHPPAGLVKQSEARKHFFFEKKKQKTFIP
jgi:hypothetical protein